MFMFIDVPACHIQEVSHDSLVVISPWNLEYRGHANKILLQAIDEVYSLPEMKYYSRIVPVVQSSGTGKSRTVDEIAKERILFSVCLRENLWGTYRDFGVL
jgi:hypothetical protein